MELPTISVRDRIMERIGVKAMDFDSELNTLLGDFEPSKFLKELPPLQVDPYVNIVEQPAKRSLRFRYLSEGRWAGSIRGANHTSFKKTFPTIEVIGYRGKTSVEVSCVLDDYPYKQHPHELVGREGCANGVCRLPIPEETMSLTFSNLGIHCIKKGDIKQSLNLRKEIGVDPFKGGFSHASEITGKRLKSLRLCFQVYLEENGNKIPLKPVVSDTIIHQQKPNKLVIVKLSHCVCLATGSEHQIMIFCEKIDKDDIEIRFYKESNNQLLWEGFGSFEDKDIHKEFGISFRAPSYMDINITTPVEVFVQLRRPSDGIFSEGLRFEYLPISTNLVPPRIGVKRYRRNELTDRLEDYQKQLNLPSTSKVQQHCNLKYDFTPNVVVDQPLYPHNNEFGTIPSLLPSFCQTWGSVDHSSRFLNTNNFNGMNLIDSDIREEPKILNQNVFANIPLNNLSINNSNELLPEETTHGRELNWQLNNSTEISF